MIDQFWTFFIAITLLTLFPGVDSLLVVRNSSRGGLADGLLTSTGICCGLFVHATVSALGISALLLHSAVAFGALKMIGGGYLLWLGCGNLWQAWRGTESGQPALRVLPPRSFRWYRSLREGFVCNVFNPKTLLFYMAFLPQFINPQRSALAQSLTMAGIHFVIAMIYQGVLAMLACRVSRWFKTGRCRRWAEGTVGLLLVTFSVSFLLERRS